GVIAHNEIQGISGDGIRHALKLHSRGLTPYTDFYPEALNWASRYIVVADNLFGHEDDNNGWTVAICPQNGQSAEGIEDVIVENNRFVHRENITNLVRSGRRLTVRGNQ